MKKSAARRETSRYRITRSLILFGVAIAVLVSPTAAQGPLAPKTKATSKDFGKRKNHLARESSPYLRLHASNPVDWYPWGPEALQKAIKENKPIFLSVGYSSCFWCHVMERQVFENEEIAAYMNEHFVNIKVDREERPDIDEVYMTALQVYFQLAKSTQGGGWPLSIFLTPDGKPIAGGTYFPPTEQPGQTSFPTVLKQIRGAWEKRERDVRNTADLIAREVARLTTPGPIENPVPLNQMLVNGVVSSIQNHFDPEFGGFDFDPQAPEGPKFPVASRLAFLQSQVGRPLENGITEPSEMLNKTLKEMAAGGMWDHLGGGFHRYSVDRRWRVPHFEKMLYDNAQLAEIYVEAYRRTGQEQYRQTAESIFEFVKREMTAPEGGFYSALDAATDGVEGARYVWSQQELENIFSAANLRIFTAAYGSYDPQIFEPGIVLRLQRPLPEVADTLRIPASELALRLADMRTQLIAVRDRRPPLSKDDKILTAWNGLMIRAYARAGKILKRQDYLDAASKAAVFLLTKHRAPNGNLLRRDAEPGEQQTAFLDDYAFLVSGLLTLHEATNEEKWLNAARRLTDEQIGGFWDQDRGGFFYTSSKQEIVLCRMKSGFDGEMPSANGVAAQNLIRLARLKVDDVSRENAEKTIAAFAHQLRDQPAQMATMAGALQEYLHWYGGPPSKAAGEGLFTGGLSSPPKPRPDMPARTPETPSGPRSANSSSEEMKGKPASLVPPAGDAVVPHIQGRAYFEFDKLPRGKESRVAIELDIDQDWHLNANPAKPDFVIPLTVSLHNNSGCELRAVQYPPGKDFTVTGIETPLSVYEDKVVVFGEIWIPENAPATVELQLQLRMQICNTQSCLPPRVLRLSGTVPIANGGEPGKRVHESIFQSALPRPSPVAVPVNSPSP